ncbi:MAG: RNA pseudouridine synthase [Gammaproteobacteria bacterium]|nr:RNA pseudouridine synthase [Gammaproteobacteria bacterium]
MTIRFEQQITIEDADLSALTHLSSHTPLSNQQIKQAMHNGCVWLESPLGTSRLRRAKKILNTGDVIHIYYDENIHNNRPEAAILIADEGGYSIWNKPYGMYSQGTRWGDHFTIYRYAETHLKPQRPAFPVHRLDRAANGLIIIAHSKKMATAFLSLFKSRNIQKRYRATVESQFTDLELPLIMSNDIDNKPALSKIVTSENSGENSLVIIEIETGRKHQIRKHLAEQGHPIVGDRLYGSARSTENMKLQACYLKFVCPISNEIKEYSL